MRGASTPLDRYRDAELTLDELVHAAARLLRGLALRPDDGRVAETVDARGVRYYQTLGVIDKPLRYEGRRAVYGYRHLLQLLSVRNLQQAGHPLHLIQRALAGRTTRTLEQALVTTIAAREEGAAAAPPLSLAQRAPAASPKPAHPDETGGRLQRLLAARIAPGITVTVDTSIVENAETVVARIEALLSSAALNRR